MAQSKKNQSENIPSGPVHLSVSTLGETPIQRCGVEYGPKARTVTVQGGSSAWRLLQADPLLKVTKATAPKAPTKEMSVSTPTPDGKAESDAAQS